MTIEETRPVARRRHGRIAAIVVLSLALVVAAALAVAWLNRRAVARDVLVGWLEKRGIQADVDIQRLELNGFVGRVRIGDAANPDVTVERVEVDYALGMPWSKAGLGVTPSRIRLIRPVARASWKDGKLSFGSLDPLIDEFRSRPPRPESRGPVVIVETGRLRLDTEYGPVSLLADARVDDGKLMRLSARMPAASLKSGDAEARGLGGTLELTTTGDRVAVSTALSAEQLSGGGLSGQALALTASGDLPYPDLKARRGDGQATIIGKLMASDLALGAFRARSADMDLSLVGQARGWIDTLAFEGRSDLTLVASRLDAANLVTRDARLSVRDAEVGFARRGKGADVRFDGPLNVALGEARFDTLRLESVSGRYALDYASSRPQVLIVSGATSARRGAWPLFGAVARDDIPELAEMKRALGAFALDAPSVRLTVGEAAAVVDLRRPARITPGNGGVLTLSPAARSIYAAAPGQAGGGALTLAATRGRGLPQATVAVPDWRLTPGGFRAELDGRAALDFGLARGLSLRTRGTLSSDRGRLTYFARDCIPLTVERLELDENDVMDASGRVCPSGQPLVVSQDGRWRATGRMEGVAADAPFLALHVADAAGRFAVTGTASGLGLTADVTRATVQDATRPRRFNPVIASGSVRLADERWSGGFDLSHGDAVLGRLTLAHDGTTGRGGVVIDAPSIVFTAGGLQPADLSPMVQDFVRSPATGSASFLGRIDWDPALPEGSSSGRLIIPSIDFVSPAGPVKGLSGTIDFTNLAPLTTAPNQSLRIATLESIAPFTDLDLNFEMDKAAIRVGAASIQAAGGTVSVEPFSVPLDRRPFSGVIILDRVQLGDLIAGSGFGDKVKLDAVVSGRLPFTQDPDSGVRIQSGTLYAVQPGRLSIQREALTGLEAGGGGDVPPNTVEDLAYQAMENLAFDVLSADVNSLDQGRIGVLFHIKGQHDPPQRQELRMSLSELISRNFLNRTLPLPSGTGIDLTLDTTLNLNQLVSDLLEVNRARSGQPSNETLR